jgi:ABC-2 type transport system ATP-binding protein
VEFLKLHGDLHSVPRPTLARRIPELLELVGLQEAAEKKLRAYSKGMLQRIGLAQALLNEPALVILDEPTSGLDPLGRRLVRDIISDLRSLGRTVFINSHLLSEIEVTCDRVAFIKEGSIVRTVDLQGMGDQVTTVTIRARPLSDETLAGLAAWSSDAQVQGDQLLLSVSEQRFLPEINRYLVNAGVDVYSLQQERTSLEDLFIQIMGTSSLS